MFDAGRLCTVRREINDLHAAGMEDRKEMGCLCAIMLLACFFGQSLLTHHLGGIIVKSPRLESLLCYFLCTFLCINLRHAFLVSAMQCHDNENVTRFSCDVTTMYVVPCCVLLCLTHEILHYGIPGSATQCNVVSCHVINYHHALLRFAIFCMSWSGVNAGLVHVMPSFVKLFIFNVLWRCVMRCVLWYR